MNFICLFFLNSHYLISPDFSGEYETYIFFNIYDPTDKKINVPIRSTSGGHLWFFRMALVNIVGKFPYKKDIHASITDFDPEPSNY